MLDFRVIHMPADDQQQNECAQWRIRSAWASTQSDQSSLCTQWVTKDQNLIHAEEKRLNWCLDHGWKFKISKILTFLQWNLKTCSMSTNINNFMFQWSIVVRYTENKAKKLLECAGFTILRLTFYIFLWKVSLKILNSGIILKTFTHSRLIWVFVCRCSYMGDWFLLR